ncbi:hypothetical protein F4779DRAFT_364458 [Xylariaceae sp. FL0662B]|nr:hypothetical protein F4779DRAFT_364458 [Xylariaceae sp. FL0662B]
MATKNFSVVNLLTAVTSVSAFWRMECRGSSGLARMDPIVDTGKVSAHSHTIHGSSGFSLEATYDDLINGNCTSCAVKQDKSAYWTPNMYFRDGDTGEFTPVPQIGGMLAYYFLRGDNITAFPPDFQMVAGSNFRRDYTIGDPESPDPPQSNWASLDQTSQADLEQRAIGFNCLNYKSPNQEPSLFRHRMPSKDFTDANCPDGLRLELMFPSCWNGEATSKDHKSHVAYPSLVGNGDCPDTHPLRLPTLFFETIWNTNAPDFQGKKGEFLNSNGDPTGYGYHGDFMSGWIPDFLQNAIDTCTNDSGDIRDCSVFTDNGPLQSDEEQRECHFHLPDLLDKENPGALSLKMLPGNLEIQVGPESATPGGGALPGFSAATSWLGSVFGGGQSTTPTASSTPSAPTLSSSSASTSSASVAAAFMEQPTTAPTPSSPDVNVLASEPPQTTSSSLPPPPPTTTPAPVVTSEPGVSYQVVSTQTVTNGNSVEEVIWKEPVVYVTEDSVTTVAARAPMAKLEQRRQDHAWRHRHHGRGR